TLGAKVIRAYEKEHGVNVPWAILIDLTAPAPRALDLAALVEQGQKLGIYSYFLFIAERTAALESLFAVAQRFSGSAFFLFSTDVSTNERLAASDELLSNTLFVPRGGSSTYPEIGALLMQKKRMFGLNCEYNAINADVLLSDAFLQTVINQGYPFLFLIPSLTCDAGTRKRVNDEVLSLRGHGRYPLFPMDLYDDLQQVDHIISDEHCMLALGPDGSVLYPASAGNLNLREHTLEELIWLTMPRVHHHR
ncbi:MAG: hypothetical protein LLF96_11950, partial [Eubacteriales bacterium]|nr:hypothetical protein [Eubacteriales bacterium]